MKNTTQLNNEIKGNKEEQCTVTAHANMRIKERLAGMKSPRRRQELAWNAYNNGVRLEDSKGVERAYMLQYKKETADYANRELVLYNDRVFVFDGNRVVTMLPADPKYIRLLERIRRKKNKRERITEVECEQNVA